MSTNNIYKVFIIAIGILFIFSSCTKVVLKIDEVPPNTPPGANIYVAGNFNFWDPGDQSYQMWLQSDSTYIIELPRIFGSISYKFTRGDWSTVEKNLCGNEITDRLIHDKQDTIYHSIESWADLDPVNCDSITIVIKNLPDSTPADEHIKIAGSFNAWQPGNNPDFILKADTVKNELKVTIPRRAIEGKTVPELQYKFVRDTTDVAEVDKFGREINARVLNFEKGDTVFVDIENWEDKVKPSDNLVTIVLTKIPKFTPKDDDIFLAGNFNNWNARDYEYKFKLQKNNTYAVSIPRKKYGLSFKITRGEWSNEFADACGNNFDNQNYNYDEIDSLFYEIEGWKDLKTDHNKYVTLVINKLPQNTPENAKLYIHSFSYDYTYEVSKYLFEQKSNGTYEITLPRRRVKDRFIISRELQHTIQVDKSGNYILDQRIESQCIDTSFIQIEAWNDYYNIDDMVSIELSVPEKTPNNASVYLTGQFNGWNPGDQNFVLKDKQDRIYEISVPRHYLKGGFKFTRGSWNKVETRTRNRFIENRVYKGSENIIKLEVVDWEDK